MAIAFSCPSCDRTYTVDDKFAGKVTACKGCQTRMVVPDAEGEPEPPPPTTGRARVVAVSPPSPPPPRNQSRREEIEARERDDGADEAPPPRSRNAAADDAAHYAEKAAKKQRRREREARRRERESESRGGGISISPTIVGGVATMTFAVVWFFVGLQFDWIFFYPPILLFMGLISFVKGMMGHED